MGTYKASILADSVFIAKDDKEAERIAKKIILEEIERRLEPSVVKIQEDAAPKADNVFCRWPAITS
jgi:hypothetical protein